MEFQNKSQTESSSGFQKNVFTDESDSENNNSIPFVTNTLASVKKRRNKNKPSFVWKYFKVIDKKDICHVIVKKKGEDQICGADYIHDEEEDGEVNNGDSTDSEQLNINTTSKILHPNLTLIEEDLNEEYDSSSDSEDSENEE
ncbi:21979_t:CDS:2, partial [Dentiscutata erythropus]